MLAVLLDEGVRESRGSLWTTEIDIARPDVGPAVDKQLVHGMFVGLVRALFVEGGGLITLKKSKRGAKAFTKCLVHGRKAMCKALGFTLRFFMQKLRVRTMKLLREPFSRALELKA